MDEPVKRKPGRPPKPKNPADIIKAPKDTHLPNNVVIPEGDNNKYTSFTLDVMKLTAINISDPAQVKQRIIEYFQLCADHDMKPGVAGLSLALGIDRRRLWEIKTGAANYYKLPQECKDAIKAAYISLESLMENYMQNGKINPVSGIFLMQNNFDYQDRRNLVVAPGHAEDAPDLKTIEAKYEELPED